MQKHVMNKLGLFLLLSSTLILASGLFSQRHALACEYVGLSNYIEVTPKLFLSPKIGKEKHEEIISLIASGRNRVGMTFGNMGSSPQIIVTTNKDEAAKFGANSTATTHLTPLGACLVFGPKGRNTDVIAHELVHAEVFHRVGWIAYLLDIPVWFNEGIALIVDHRPPFLVENIELTQEDIDAVRSKEYGFEFFNGEDTHKNYLSSRLAVKNINPSMLYDQLSEIRNGKSFEDVFGVSN